MHRFFVSPGQIEDGQVTIDGEDFKHITRVLRLRDDEAIEVCDGRGTDHIVTVETVGKDSLTGRILESRPSRGETDGLRVTLFQGVPKGQKMESVIQKCVEAGAASIVPFTSVRTVVKLGDKEKKRPAAGSALPTRPPSSPNAASSPMWRRQPPCPRWRTRWIIMTWCSSLTRARKKTA
ncbi:RNA methyltransferase RsmE family [Eubacterium limosum]|nr:RNA methyltransferase RsmE family [Eubacterium limosum]